MFDPHGTRQVYKLYTLIDITKTNEVKNSKATKERYQQSNFETLWQVIQLRIQCEITRVPKKIPGDMLDYKFGTSFKGKKNVWEFVFEVDQDQPFGKNFNGMYGDFDGVPFINNLDDNAKFPNTVFNCTDDKIKNLYCELVI